MSKKNYFAMDGRWWSNPDSAMCCDVIEAKNDKEATKKFKREWRGHDYVLVTKDGRFVASAS